MKREEWKIKIYSSKNERCVPRVFHLPAASLRHLCGFLFVFFTLTACSGLQKPKTEPFYAENPTPPPKQEFRWSNGKMPKSFDPALASASPEADFARALFEGLTDNDSKTLQPVPAVAVSWTASEDFKTWTFTLRQDAKWSNGEAVTAKDFVRSWKRLVELGDKVKQRTLLKNIVGMDTENVLPVFANEEIDSSSGENNPSEFLNNQKPGDGRENTNANSAGSAPPKNETPKTQNPPQVPLPETTQPKNTPKKKEANKDHFGVEAVDDFTLKVSLVQPDRYFAALVAHPIFRPVYDGGREFGNDAGLGGAITTNGAFRLAAVEQNTIVLERAAFYWNAKQTKLETVRFIPAENAENALAAYRAGEVDAVTNADFKPLALKLLTPYDDFRRTTHAALNFYEFNLKQPQFADERVRRALAMAIERERLTEDEMDGASLPALGFLPFTEGEKISQDAGAAKKLLSEAGHPEGKNFPTIRLLVNRNDMQRRIARAVAKMWKKNLNLETEIIVKDQADFEAAYQNGDYDIVRRGVVLPTPDETANMLALFPPEAELEKNAETKKAPDSAGVSTDQILNEKSAESNLDLTNTAPREESAAPDAGKKNENSDPNAQPAPAPPGVKEKEPLLTEREALEKLPAIPLYFPTSYSLVKPYVQGFEMNALDAPSLKNVEINHNWQPSNQKILSNNQK